MKLTGVCLFRTAEITDTLVMGLFSGQRSPFRGSDNSGNSFRGADMAGFSCYGPVLRQRITVNPPVLRWIMLGNMLSGITHTRGAIPLPSFRVSDNSGNSFRTAETADTLEVDRGMPF